MRPSCSACDACCTVRVVDEALHDKIGPITRWRVPSRGPGPWTPRRTPTLARDTAIARDGSCHLVTGPDLTPAMLAHVVWPRPRAPFLLETSVPDSFAMGDVRHGSMKRAASAVGEGTKAMAFIHQHLSACIRLMRASSASNRRRKADRQLQMFPFAAVDLTRPSWVSAVRPSSRPRSSTILPSTTFNTVVPVNCILRPVAAGRPS